VVLRYRRAAAVTVRGRAGGVRLRIDRPGTYRVRVAYRDGGRLRHTNVVRVGAT
jgi:hypothetical protein